MTDLRGDIGDRSLAGSSAAGVSNGRTTSADSPALSSVSSSAVSAGTGAGVGAGGVDPAALGVQNVDGGEVGRGGEVVSAPAFEPEAAGLISAEQAVRLRAVPIRFEGARGPGRRVVAVMVDVDDEASADELSIVTGYPVRVEGIDPASFEELVRRAFGATAAAMAARLGGGAGGGVDDDLVANLQAVDADDVRRMAEQPTVINLVNLIILEAVRDRASDVHLEPFDGRFVVKYRIDGILRERNSRRSVCSRRSRAA